MGRLRRIQAMTDATTPARPVTGRDWLILVLFVLLVFGGGSAIGIYTAPGEWYAGLAKPSFNPPNWIFGPVWSTLYLLIAFAGWRVWRARAGQPQLFWWLQLLLNFTWSPVFFGAQMIGLALGIIVSIFLLILFFIGTTWPRDRLAALCFVPYALWVGFASALNASILFLNG